MNYTLVIIDSLLKYISFIFLIYCSVNFCYKLILKKQYSINDFRISLITLIFVFFKFSASLLWIFSDIIFEKKNLITFIIVLLGFYLHNKVVESRKKFFRLFFFYSISIYFLITT